jgi:hypothetical protein
MVASGASVFLAAVGAYMLSSEGAYYPRPWVPYAFHEEANRLELLFPLGEYESREDCMHAVRREVLETEEDKRATDEMSRAISQAGMNYKDPSGCLYMGYQNRYIQYIVNFLLNRGNFHCIMKVLSPTLRKEGYLYYPALLGARDDDKNCCVL